MRAIGYPYPSLRHGLLLALVVLPLMQLLLLPLSEWSSDLALVAAELSLLAIAGFTIRQRRWSAEDLLLLNAAPPALLLFLCPIAIAAALIISELDRLVSLGWQWLDWSVPLSLQHEMLQMQVITDSGDVLPTLVVVVLLPAICEEVFFRGFVYTGLRYHHGAKVAWVGSALIFAAAHLNPWHFPAYVGLGLFFGWLVHRTHSIYPAILAHGVNNLLSVTAVNLRTHLGIDPLGASQSIPPALLVGAVIVAGLGAWWMLRWRPVMPAISPFVQPRAAQQAARIIANQE